MLGGGKRRFAEGEHVFDSKDIKRDLPVRVGLRLADTETSERIEFLLRGRLLPNEMIVIPADAYHDSLESGTQSYLVIVLRSGRRIADDRKC